MTDSQPTDSPETRPDMPEGFSEERYLTERLDDQIDWYDKKSQWNQRWFKRLQVTQIVVAAAIPFFVGILDGKVADLIIGGLGLVVAIAAGVQTLYRFQEHWVQYRSVCETLRHERFLYLTGTSPYDDENEAFHLLVRRVERRISQEHSKWVEEMRSQEKGPVATSAGRMSNLDPSQPPSDNA